MEAVQACMQYDISDSVIRMYDAIQPVYVDKWFRLARNPSPDEFRSNNAADKFV